MTDHATARCRVVLHRPQFARNVGMVARAMACFDVRQLVLIGPPFDLRSIEAREGAVFAQSLLVEARQFETVEQYHATLGSGFEVYFSGKPPQWTQAEDLSALSQRWLAENHPLATDPSLPIALHFGPEASGFERREIDLAHCVVGLPCAGGDISFNLSHAVVLALGLLHHSQLIEPSRSELRERKYKPVWPGHLIAPALLRSWLDQLGFDLSSSRTSVLWTVQRFLMSRQGSENEVRTFEKVLQQNLRLLRELRGARGEAALREGYQSPKSGSPSAQA